MEDTHTLSEKLENLHDEAFSWALNLSRYNRDEAMDVLHDAYIKVLSGKAKFGERSTFKTWFFGVIRYTARERWRRRAVRNALLLKFKPEPLKLPLPDENAEKSDQKTKIIQAIHQLSDRQREIIDLVFYHDLTVDEASKVMGIGLGSARTHYARAKTRLAEMLRNSEGEHGE